MNRSLGLIRNIALPTALVVISAGMVYGYSQVRAVDRTQAVRPDAGAAVTSATTPTASPTSATTSAVSSSATPTSALPAVVAAFSCSSASGGAGAGNLSAVRVAHHAGYDRIVFQFTGTLPAYMLTPQNNARFVRDASGQPVTLLGSAGLKLVLQNASSYPSYAGSGDLTPTLPLVQEVARTGDFERVLSWGIGLNRSACTRVLELSSPARLVIDVQTPEAAG
jgi:hypothetical protein